MGPGLCLRRSSAPPPQPGLTQAPLSSPPDPATLSLVLALPPSFFSLEVTGLWLRRAYYPSPHTTNLSLPGQFARSMFPGFAAGSRVEQWGALGPPMGLSISKPASPLGSPKCLVSVLRD